METTINGVRLVLVEGSITDETTDAIVNAANTAMRGGGGVDGAIHRAAGREMLLELQRTAPHGARTGEVVVTPGYDLAAKHVFHIAGPVWNGGGGGEAEKLTTCYANALTKAKQMGLRSIAFPSISTGIYGFPIDRASPIALGEAVRAARAGTSLETIRFILFSDRDRTVYEGSMASLGDDDLI